eukprot:3068989-Lingulodinium_polyedra.AAC.1
MASPATSRLVKPRSARPSLAYSSAASRRDPLTWWSPLPTLRTGAASLGVANVGPMRTGGHNSART